MYQPIEGEKQCIQCGQCKPVSLFIPQRNKCRKCKGKLDANGYRRRKLQREAVGGLYPPSREDMAANQALREWRGPVSHEPLRWAA